MTILLIARNTTVVGILMSFFIKVYNYIIFLLSTEKVPALSSGTRCNYISARYPQTWGPCLGNKGNMCITLTHIHTFNSQPNSYLQ